MIIKEGWDTATMREGWIILYGYVTAAENGGWGEA